MAFFLYKEYQLEKLAESFADNVYDRRQVGEITPENLLAAHTVIVQTRGMGEYLRQVLAEKKTDCRQSANAFCQQLYQ